MLKEFVDRILSLSPIQYKEVENRLYSDKPLNPIKKPLLDTVEIGTLTGFSDAIKAKVNKLQEKQCMIRVESPVRVCLESVDCDLWGDRQTHLVAELPDFGQFQFNRFLEQEPFLIGLQAFFVDGPNSDRDTVMKLAGTLKAEHVSESVDNGVTQTAAVRSGVSLAANVEVKRLVTLYPYRTFREIAQPGSQFVFRLQNRQGQVPMLGLFLADGEQWRAEATQRIKEWLATQIQTIPVIA